MALPYVCASCRLALRTSRPFRPFKLITTLPSRRHSSTASATTTTSSPPPKTKAYQLSSWPTSQTNEPLSNSTLHPPHPSTTQPQQQPPPPSSSSAETLTITPRASHRLLQIQSSDSNPSLCLRITVESGGCHGFQYLMSLTSTNKLNEEDGDKVFESPEGAKVVCDEASLELLKGGKVDYTMELIGSQFKVVDIPGARSSCGCGTSFDVGG
ncbi:MAG: hypothetical protein M1820_003095 [Bogoriella megaspora]|nr:MAG: hypothetical protein M1820_003095 [Bogoriella megaspora]